MGISNKYGFTSREMEYIARDPMKSINRNAKIHGWIRIAAVVLFATLFGIIVYQIAQPLLHTRAAEPIVLVEGRPTLSSFCKQAILDHDSYGRDLSESLKDYCEI